MTSLPGPKWSFIETGWGNGYLLKKTKIYEESPSKAYGESVKYDKKGESASMTGPFYKRNLIRLIVVISHIHANVMHIQRRE